MSEKRLDYDLLWNNYYQVIELDDGDTDYLRRLSPTEIIKRLNEQQATIKELEEEIKLLKPTNIEQYEQIVQLQKENEQLKIANAKWLDKTVQDKQIRYNNANHKELVKKYLQLKEENEQLRKELKRICNLECENCKEEWCEKK